MMQCHAYAVRKLVKFAGCVRSFFLGNVRLVLGLPLGLEAPVMTPNGVIFLFFLSSPSEHHINCLSCRQSVLSGSGIETDLLDGEFNA